MDDIQKEAVHPLEAMGISGEVVQAFNWMGFHNLTAIQEKCIPLMMDGHDFIFSVVGETLGFIGALVLLTLYAFVIYRMLLLAFHTNDKFGQLIIVGVMAMLVFHVYENIGMCIGVMPITGIPLPFISYGGTNLVVNMAGVGLVLNVTQHKSSMDLKNKVE